MTNAISALMGAEAAEANPRTRPRRRRDGRGALPVGVGVDRSSGCCSPAYPPASGRWSTGTAVRTPRAAALWIVAAAMWPS